MQHQGDSDLLELLCYYRGLFAHKGLVDRMSTLSVAEAVVYGERLLGVARRRGAMAARRRAHDEGRTAAP